MLEVNSSKSVKDIIEEKGYYASTTKGISMLPMIRSGRDCIYVIKPSGRLKKFDVALYQRKDGTLVLHRVMKVFDDNYSMCGDHQYNLENNVSDDQVIGVLKEFYRGQKKIACNDFGYKIYIKFWCTSLFLRKMILNTVWLIKNVINKIWKKKY